MADFAIYAEVLLTGDIQIGEKDRCQTCINRGIAA
jgi:hypothetical protein